MRRATCGYQSVGARWGSVRAKSATSVRARSAPACGYPSPTIRRSPVRPVGAVPKCPRTTMQRDMGLRYPSHLRVPKPNETSGSGTARRMVAERGSDAPPAGTKAPGLVGVRCARKVRLRYGPEARLPAGTEARPFVGVRYAQLGPYRSAPVPRRNERQDFGTATRDSRDTSTADLWPQGQIGRTRHQL